MRSEVVRWAALLVFACAATAAAISEDDVARIQTRIDRLQEVRGQSDETRAIIADLRALGDSLETAEQDSLAARTWQAAAWTLFRGGEVIEAHSVWERALEAGRRHDRPDLIASLLNTAGIGNAVTGDLEASIELWTEAIGLCREIGDPKQEAAFWGNLANAYNRLGRIPDVRYATERSLALAHEHGVDTSVMNAHNRLASVMQSMGELEEALAHADSAIAIALRVAPEQASAILSRRASIRYDVGRHEEALSDLAESDSVARAAGDLRAVNFNQANRAIMLIGMDRAEEALAALDALDERFGQESEDRGASVLTMRGYALVKLGRLDDARENLEAALETFVRMRDALDESANQAAIFSSGGDTYAALAEYHRIRKDAATAWQYAEDGRSIELRERLSPEGSDAPASLAEIQDVLRESDAALLQYTDGRTIPVVGFVVTADTVHAFPAGRVGSLLLDADLALTFMASGLSDEECAGPLRRIRDAVLVPALPYLKSVRRLYVVPPSLLIDLPFEPLPLPDEESGALGDGVALTYLPGASSLLALTRRPGATEPMLVFADPSASRDERTSSERTRSLANVPLPEARAEALLVATREATVLIGNEAVKPRFREASAASVLHFATHAIVDRFSTSESGLLLAGDDGLLTAAEVEKVPLGADLVTLSGCRTRGGHTVFGEGTFGLARAFLISGARSVVTSAWDVEDGAARRFMELFYESLRAGRSRDESLFAARQDMKAEGYPLRDRAAFVLTGVGHLPVESLAGRPARRSGSRAGWIAALGIAAAAVFLFRRARSSA